MPLTGAIPEGRSFFCPRCGALYAVTYSRLSSSDSNFARCVVCGQIMDKWGFDQGAYIQAHSSTRRLLITLRQGQRLGSDHRRTSSGSLAILAAIRSASSRVSRLAAAQRSRSQPNSRIKKNVARS